MFNSYCQHHELCWRTVVTSLKFTSQKQCSGVFLCRGLDATNNNNTGRITPSFFDARKGKGRVPRKLNDKQVLELVTEHANGTSISKLAKDYELSRDTVRKYLQEYSETRQKLVTIKNESVTEWLKAQKGTIMGILDQIIGLLPKRLKDASVKDLMGAYKILTETSINNVESKGETNTNEEPTTITVEIVDNGKKD